MNKLFSPSFLSNISPLLSNSNISGSSTTSLHAPTGPSLSQGLLIPYKLEGASGATSSSAVGELYHEVNAATVMLAMRVFNESSPLNQAKCVAALTKLFYLFYSGTSGGGGSTSTRRNSDTGGEAKRAAGTGSDHAAKLSEAVATEVFFNITKGFQSRDLYLRRLVYLAIKELVGVARDTLIVTSSLTSDIINGKLETVNRAGAIRALCRVTDGSMISGIERFVKQCLMDHNHPYMMSSSLVSCIHLYHGHGGSASAHREVIRRWIGPDAPLSSLPGLVKYHGLGLLFELRKEDRASTLKLLQKYAGDLGGSSSNGGGGGTPMQAALSVCLLLKVVQGVLDEGGAAPRCPEINWKGFFVANHTPAKEIMAYEAAAVIVAHCVRLGSDRTPVLTSGDISYALSTLQAHLGSSKSLLKFAAIRQLYKLAQSRPDLVAVCNTELEGLISDANRSIASLALTTLLKTGAESSIDRLLACIHSYLAELSDEVRVNIILGIGVLAQKFANKRADLVAFLRDRLRDEGGLAYKKAIVGVMSQIADRLGAAPPATSTAADLALLTQVADVLAEFIEDCEYADVATDALHVLSDVITAAMARCRPDDASHHTAMMRYIRHIYNRLLLESPAIRMAALGTLIRIALADDDSAGGSLQWREMIGRLVRNKCTGADEEDDIRDRAIAFLSVFARDVAPAHKGAKAAEVLKTCYLNHVLYELNALEDQLASYLASHAAHMDADASVSGDEEDLGERLCRVPVLATDKVLAEWRGERGGERLGVGGTEFPLTSPKTTAAAPPVPRSARLREQVEMLLKTDAPHIHAQMGVCLRGCPGDEALGLALTEADTEFRVKLQPLIYATAGCGCYLVLAYQVTNTLDDMTLKQVWVRAVPPETDADETMGCSIQMLAHVPIQTLPGRRSEAEEGLALSVYQFSMDLATAAAQGLETLVETALATFPLAGKWTQAQLHYHYMDRLEDVAVASLPQDIYSLKGFELTLGDFMALPIVSPSRPFHAQFIEAVWRADGSAAVPIAAEMDALLKDQGTFVSFAETKEMYQLNHIKTLAAAVDYLRTIFRAGTSQGESAAGGGSVMLLDESALGGGGGGAALSTGSTSHTLYMAGAFCASPGPWWVFIRCRMAVLSAGVTIELAVKSPVVGDRERPPQPEASDTMRELVAHWVANAL